MGAVSAIMGGTSAGTATGTAYGVMLNLRADLDGLGEALNAPPYGKPPQAPILYIKPANTFAGEAARVVISATPGEVQLCASLALVVGRPMTRVNEAEALDHLAGYAIAIDVSEPHASLYRPAIRERCRDGFLPVGPLIDRAAVADPDDLEVRLRINGALAGAFSTSGLVRPVARLLADVTDFMTLEAGDVLLAGVQAFGPRARAGDEACAEIDGLGRLPISLVAEAEQ